MPVRIEPNAEPIPGYRLIERLGAGGFGEVWKAEAPGGMLKAIKFVYGDLESMDDEEGSRANQESKSLERVKEVRHPYILTIERFDVIEGQLVIVTELADRTMWDRFKECRAQGLPGIPRAELLGYMAETAEALDLMNDIHELQHLDIKPQNLFLVHNHIKVADFGLAKNFGGRAAATITGGVTPVYAAPETFDGWFSRFSDQYSLAIVYQELLTGQRPFTGATMRQLVLQHLQSIPDLASLPVADRAVVSKALAKNPDERYPHCKEFIQALRLAAAAPAARPLPGPPVPGSFADKSVQTQVPGRFSARLPADGPPPEYGPLPESQVTRDARGKNLPPSAAPELADQDKGPSLESRPQVLPLPPELKNTESPEVPPEVMTGWSRTAPLGHRPPSAAAEHGAGILQPALVLGLGKLGLDTLRRLRKLFTQEFGHADALPRVRLLGIDTDPETVSAAGKGDPDALLRNHEVLLARLHRPTHYLKNREDVLAGWLNPKHLFRIPRQQNSAGLRSLGRLAFVDHHRLLSRRFEGELQACSAQDTWPEASRHVDIGLRTRVPRVYVVTCLAGNTGSGMFVDTAYVIRQLLRKQGYPNAEVVGLFFVPAAGREGIRSPALANAYAALTELNYFSSGQLFSARYEVADAKESQAFTEAGPPFQRCLVLPLPDRTNSAPEPAEALEQAAQLIYREVASVLGQAADEARRAHHNHYQVVGQAPFQSLGMYRILWPRRQLVQQTARNLCKRLVEGWMTKDTGPISAEVRAWSLEQWEAQGMRAEQLIARHQEKCEKKLGQAPDRMFQEFINPLVNVLGNKRKSAGGEVNFGPTVQVMDHLEKLVGIPEECRPHASHPPEPGLVEKALADASATVAEESEQKLAEAIIRLIEQPAYRLAGAEEGLRQFCTCVEQALQAQESLAKELQEHSVQTYQRIGFLLECPASPETRTTIWRFGRSIPTDSASVGAELLDLIQAYAKCRFHSLILFHVNRLYVSLRGHLSDQIREVGFCRQRLGELAGLVANKPGEPLAEPRQALATEQNLLPEGCTKVEEAIELLEKEITLEDLVAFDQRVQAIVQKEFRALVQVCMGPSNVVRNLAPAMVLEAEAFLDPRLEGNSVADMLLKQKGGPDGRAGDELLRAFDEAAPEPDKTGAGKEISFVVVPGDAPGAQLKKQLEEVLPAAKVVDSPCADEIVFYREQLQLTAADLEQLGPIAQEAYRQKSALDPATLHSRDDIEAWHTAAVRAKC